MSTPTHARSDLLAGLALAAFGLLGAVLSLDLRMGTAIAMGPGYYPLLVHTAIVVLGLVIALRSLRKPRAPARPFAWRPLLTISAALLAFWALVEHVGFVLAGLSLMLVAIRAEDRISWPRALIFSGITVALASALFVGLLGLPFPLWPSGH